MNCDTAFDLMTDPHGSRSGALVEHFANCPRCRRMQETLAPALNFLDNGASSDETPSQCGEVAGSSSLREPFVTTEALQLARQAAARLIVRAESPHVRLARLVRRTAPYAGAFAAGLLLAALLFTNHDRPSDPSGTCTRRAALQDDVSRTPDQIRVLARSCTVCHSAPRGDEQSINVRGEGTPNWDWLLPYLDRQPSRLADDAGGASHPLIAAVPLDRIAPRTDRPSHA